MAARAKRSATLEEARAAKSRIESMLARNRKVNGIGLSRWGGGWCIKVNLSGPSRASFPEEIDGVPVRVEQVGQITKR